MAQQFLIPALRTQPHPSGQPGQGGARMIGVYSHSPHRGDAFAVHNRLVRAYENLDELLARNDVDAVYVSSQPRHQ